MREAEQEHGMLSEQAACPGFGSREGKKPLFAVGTEYAWAQLCNTDRSQM